MSATFVLKSGRPRTTVLMAGLLRLLQMALMGAGIVFLVAMVDLHRGEGLVMEQLQGFSESAAELPPELPAAGSVPTAALDSLTPNMRRALQFMSRRYRVSGDALEPIFAAAESAAHAVQVDPLLVVAVIAIESRFNPFSESVVGAQGLMQVMPRFHQDKLPHGADEMSFFDPVLNVQVGTRILKESITRNGGLVEGLQQFAGALGDPELRYSNKVLAERARLEAAVRRGRVGAA